MFKYVYDSFRACVQTTIASGGGGALALFTDRDIIFYSLVLCYTLVSGGYSVRALSKYLGRDTTYTMTMWAGLVRRLSGS